MYPFNLKHMLDQKIFSSFNIGCLSDLGMKCFKVFHTVIAVRKLYKMYIKHYNAKCCNQLFMYVNDNITVCSVNTKKKKKKKKDYKTMSLNTKISRNKDRIFIKEDNFCDTLFAFQRDKTT